MVKTKKELLEEYNTLLERLNKADKYFNDLKDYNANTIEKTKEYKAMINIINKLNELHNIIYIDKNYIDEPIETENEEEEECCF